MNNQTLKTFAFWFMILLIICLAIYLVHWTKTESYQCMSNPYTYSIKLLQKSNDALVSCVCGTNKQNSQAVLLTEDGFKPINLPSDIPRTSNSSFRINLNNDSLR